MSFLSNIKFQYNLKILQDYLSTGDLNNFFKNLEKHRANKNQKAINVLRVITT